MKEIYIVVTFIAALPILYAILTKADWSKLKLPKIPKKAKPSRPTSKGARSRSEASKAFRKKVRSGSKLSLNQRIKIWIRECQDTNKVNQLLDLMVIYGRDEKKLLNEIYNKFGNDPAFPSLNMEYKIHRNKSRLDDLLR